MKVAPTLEQTKAWFKDSVLPKRTAAAGFSTNRLWKSPRALVRGNTEDPNGLCGDAAAFVVEEFLRKFGQLHTADGFFLGVILWEGSISNHIANVMLIRNKTSPESYKWNSKTRIAVPVGEGSYTSAQLLGLQVLDLYYKKEHHVLDWWKGLASGMSGKVKIGTYANIGG
jgi:hypothetical protein